MVILKSLVLNELSRFLHNYFLNVSSRHAASRDFGYTRNSTVIVLKKSFVEHLYTSDLQIFQGTHKEAGELVILRHFSYKFHNIVSIRTRQTAKQKRQITETTITRNQHCLDTKLVGARGRI